MHSLWITVDCGGCGVVQRRRSCSATRG